jgi:hypothetical protein
MNAETQAGAEPAATAAPTATAANDIVQIPGGDAERISIREAGRALANFRHQRREGAAESPDEPAVAPPEATGDEASEAAAAADGTTAEPANAVERAEPRPIAPPRSWSSEEQERFKALPRETQQYLAGREEARDRDISRQQGEAAAERKTIEAERARMIDARRNYEEALPSVMRELAQQQAADFSDINTAADFERLAREDLPRYLQWDAQQKRIASVLRQSEAARTRQAQERETGRNERMQREHDLLVEKLPELADVARRNKVQANAVEMLKGLGFAAGELEQLWRGDRELSLHDHRLQLLIHDGLRLREAQEKARGTAARPVPPVQRPGVAQSRGAAQDAAISTLTRRLDQSGSLKDAVRLIAERRKAAR